MSQGLAKIADLDQSTLNLMVQLAFEYKNKHDLGIRQESILAGKSVAMVFEKPSLRTKVAFELATRYLGGTPIFLSSPQILASGGQVVGRESIPDIARNLERFVDLILARVYSHQTIVEIREHTRIPVINALCDLHHPSQAIADLMAIRWHSHGLANARVAYVGDGNNVATSLMQICALQGIPFAYASPDGYEIPEIAVKEAISLAGSSRPHPVRFRSPREAVQGANFVYTDTFVSMGQEREQQQRLKAFADYKVTDELLDFASDNVKFMHCLPAHRGEEVTDAVMDGPRSIVFDQAECRMHVAKALLSYYLAPRSLDALSQTATGPKS